MKEYDSCSSKLTAFNGKHVVLYIISTGISKRTEEELLTVCFIKQSWTRTFARENAT